MEASEQARMQKVLKEHSENRKQKISLYKTAKAYLEKFHSAQNWLNNIKAELTRKKYAIALYRYCAGIGYNPDELLKLKLSITDLILLTDEERVKLREGFDEKLAEHTLENFLAKAKFKNKLGIKTAVVSFYKKSGKELSSDVAQNIQQREKQPEEYNIPNIQDIEELSEATDNYRDEFLVWLLESSGMRRGTVSKLTFGDLLEVRHINNELHFLSLLDKEKIGELDALVPVFIRIGSERLKGKYKGLQQTTFLHFKAYQKLQQYIRWLQTSFHIEITPETPLFLALKKPHKPLGYSFIRDIVVNASVNAFGNGKVYTPHDLRRFNQTALETSKMSSNWVKHFTSLS